MATEVSVRVSERLGERNVYGVPVRQWRKWPEIARRVFNLHFYELKENQAILTHPKTQRVSKREWRTQAWNSAWLAADSVVSALRAMSAMVVFALLCGCRGEVVAPEPPLRDEAVGCVVVEVGDGWERCMPVEGARASSPRD